MSRYETDDRAAGDDPADLVAFFRPDDGRADRATAILEELGVEPLSDPMLAISPTEARPREDADVAVLTSRSGAELAAAAGWSPADRIVAIGPATAEALAAAGFEVDRTPAEYSSSGLVDALAGEVDGARVEVARSDHGSETLLEGLTDAGAYVHETVLYRLDRPSGAGASIDAAADGTLDGACFTSSLTVEHFLEVAAERDRLPEVLAGLDGAAVGAIGEPTRETAEARGIAVDVVPETAEFEALARAVVDRL